MLRGCAVPLNGLAWVVDGEERGSSSAHGTRRTFCEISGEDLAARVGRTTKQAAKVLGVSRRSVQGYVRSAHPGCS